MCKAIDTFTVTVARRTGQVGQAVADRPGRGWHRTRSAVRRREAHDRSSSFAGFVRSDSDAPDTTGLAQRWRRSHDAPRVRRGGDVWPRAGARRSPADLPVLTFGPMRWIRSHVARVAGGWLVLQLGLRVFVPSALCSTMPARTAGTTCTCGHGNGAMCPMHHGSAASKSSAPKHDCSCRGTTDPAAGIAATLVDTPAVMTVAARVIPIPIPRTAPFSAAVAPIDTPTVPTSPPPRA